LKIKTKSNNFDGHRVSFVEVDASYIEGEAKMKQFKIKIGQR
jgi:hypothetical protein